MTSDLQSTSTETVSPASAARPPLPHEATTIEKRRNRFPVQALQSRKVRIALAAYLVAAVFGVGYVLTRTVASGQSQAVALAVAIGAALPLVLGFVGERISSIKTPWVEVSLAAATVPTSTDIPSDELNRVTSSGSFELAQQLRRLIAAPGSQLLEIDLRAGDYWWPTRLFLFSALLSDYTDVCRLVFVQGVSRQYIGMADPAAVRGRLEATIPGLNAAYAAARASAITAAINGEPGPRPLDGPQPAGPTVAPPDQRLDYSRIVEWTVLQWPQAVRIYAHLDEVEQPDRVGRSWLARSLGDDLRWAAITTDGGPTGTLLRYRIITMPEDFVALVTADRLENVVSRCSLAASIASSHLAQQLDGP